MKSIKLQKQEHIITSAIFFSLLIHFAAGVILLFSLSTNPSYTSKINGINLVWISFAEKKISSDVAIKNNRLTQKPNLAVKRALEIPANTEMTTPHQENIQISTVASAGLININGPAKNEKSGDTEIKEKLHDIDGYSMNETTGKISNSNTVIAYPLYKENEPPVYPEIARIRGYEGIVLVSAEILPNGRVGEIKIRKSSGYAILDKSAIEAVKPWKFEPAKKSGSPFTAWVELPIKFILHNNS